MKSFSALRGKLAEHDIDQRYLAELLGKSIWYISRRMTGTDPWDLADMYKMLEIINEPPEKLHYYFPPNWNLAAQTKAKLRLAK